MRSIGRIILSAALVVGLGSGVSLRDGESAQGGAGRGKDAGARHLNDPALTNDDPKDDWGLRAIGATKVWEITRGDPGTVIAVIDRGVLVSHEELKGKIVSPTSSIRTGRQIGPNSTLDHGTGVAIVAAGAGDNGVGTSGVCPRCSMMPIQVPAGGDFYTQVDAWIEAVYRAIQNGARVANVSLEIAGKDKERAVARYKAPDGRAWAEREFIDWRDRMQPVVDRTLRAAEEAGLTVVVGAGNDGIPGEFFPFCYSRYSLCVGGVGLEAGGTLGPYADSNHGGSVHVSAPAVDIFSGKAEPGGRSYDMFTGTSYAAPHVSGLAALILTHKPDLKPREIRYAIIAGALGRNASKARVRWILRKDVVQDELKRWTQAFMLLSRRADTAPKMEDLEPALLSLIPPEYQEKWYDLEVDVPEKARTIGGKAVGALINAPAALASAQRLDVPRKIPTLNVQRQKLAASVGRDDLVRVYELLRLVGDYSGSLDPEDPIELVGTFTLQTKTPYTRLDVVRKKSPGDGYSEWLEYMSPGRFRHHAEFKGQDHSQGAVEAHPVGAFLLVKNLRTGGRILYHRAGEAYLGQKGVVGGFALLEKVFDPKKVKSFVASPFCSVAGCGGGTLVIGSFTDFNRESYVLRTDVSIYSAGQKVAEGLKGWDFSFVLPAGPYRARVVDPSSGSADEFEVVLEEGRTVRREVEFPKGVLRVRTFGPGGQPLKTELRFYVREKEIAELRGGADVGHALFLSAGQYRVRAIKEHAPAVSAEAAVVIENGKEVARELTLAWETLTLHTFMAAGMPLGAQVSVFSDAREVKRDYRNDGEFRFELSPGTYRIRVEDPRQSRFNTEVEVTVETGKSLRREVKLPMGVLAVRALAAAGRPLGARVSVFSGASEVKRDYSNRGEFQFLLPPGEYRVLVERLGKSGVKKEFGVTIDEGKTVQKDVTLP